MPRINKIVIPSVPVNCRAFVECDEIEFTILAAVQACHWVKDPEVPIGAEGIHRLLPRVPLRTIERGLASLKKRGILEGIKGFGKPSKFAIYLEDLPFQALRDLLQNRQVGGNGEPLQFRLDGGNDPANMAETSRQVGGNTINTDSKEDSKPQTSLQAFEDWWRGYPNKGSKKAALKAWEKLNPNEPLRVLLGQDVAMRARSEKWTKNNGDFVPLGATYLNGERWNDPAPPDVATAYTGPACEHPADSFAIQETYANGSAYGFCRACQRTVTIPGRAA